MAATFSPQTDIYQYSFRKDDMQPHGELKYVLSNENTYFLKEYLSTDLPQ